MAKPKVHWDSGVTKPTKPKKTFKTSRPLMPGVGKGKLKLDDVNESESQASVDAWRSILNKPTWEPNAVHERFHKEHVELDNKFDVKSTINSMPIFINDSALRRELLTPGMYKTNEMLYAYVTRHQYPAYFAGMHQCTCDKDIIPIDSAVFFIKHLAIDEVKISDKSSAFASKAAFEVIRSDRSLFLFNGKPVIIGDTTTLIRL